MYQRTVSFDLATQRFSYDKEQGNIKVVRGENDPREQTILIHKDPDQNWKFTDFKYRTESGPEMTRDGRRVLTWVRQDEQITISDLVEEAGRYKYSFTIEVDGEPKSSPDPEIQNQREPKAQ